MTPEPNDPREPVTREIQELQAVMGALAEHLQISQQHPDAHFRTVRRLQLQVAAFQVKHRLDELAARFEMLTVAGDE